MGATYADHWNSNATRNGYEASSGPKLVVLSGPWDSVVEESDMMEYELTLPDMVAEALTEIRAPDFDYGGEVLVDMMQVDYVPNKSTLVTVLPDTNVMISYLNLLDAFVKFLATCPDISLSILVPGIVISELDGLRKAKGRSCQSEAQDANRWAATELSKRSVVRGQRDAATLVPGGSWRRHYYGNGKENPDGYIIDCALFERSQSSEGMSIVLTLDQNCAAQCLSNGLIVVQPQKAWSLKTFILEIARHACIPITPQHHLAISHLDSSVLPIHPLARAHPTGQVKSPSAPDWANAASTRRRKPPPKATSLNSMMQTGAVSAYSSSSAPSSFPSTPVLPPRDMEIDDFDGFVPPPSIQIRTDPRDDLQTKLRDFLASSLPPLIESSIRNRNRLSTSAASDAGRSTHARKPRPPIARSKQAMPGEESTDWKTWSVKESVLFLANFPPPLQPHSRAASLCHSASSSPSSGGGSAGKSPPLSTEFTPVTISNLQSLASLVHTDRRGREFGRGDWDRACLGFGTLCPEAKEMFENAVRAAFEADMSAA